MVFLKSFSKCPSGGRVRAEGRSLAICELAAGPALAGGGSRYSDSLCSIAWKAAARRSTVEQIGGLGALNIILF